MSEQDKAALLRQLSISKEDTTEGSSQWPTIVASVLFGVLLGSGIVWFFTDTSISVSAQQGAASASVFPASEGRGEGADRADLSRADKNNSDKASVDFTSNKPSNPSEKSPATQNDKPRFDTADAILNASGYVTARLMATVSAEVMGRLKTVDVEEGMQVQQGQRLATIDDTLARLDWQLSKAQIGAIKQRLAGLNTELNEARRVLTRVRSLDQKNFTSDAQLTRAQADVDKLDSDKSALQAELNVSVLRAKRQQEVLADYTVTAPFSGVVTVKNAQAGEIVAPSSAGGGFTRTGICTIVDMDSLEIEVDVNEAYIGRVYKNQAIVAHLDAYEDWAIPASVIAVIPTANRSKATVRVRVAIHAKDSRILPEMGVKVSFFDNK